MKLIHPTLLLTLLLAAGACGLAGRRRTPTPAVLADTFFSGRAYIDRNGNGVVDPGDPPLAGARLTVDGFGAVTDASGFAMITIPGGWDAPVTAQMAPPESGGYTLIGPVNATLRAAGPTSATFLFDPVNGLPSTRAPSSPAAPNAMGTRAPSLTGTTTPGISSSYGITETVMITPTISADIADAGSNHLNVTYCTPQPGVNLLMDVYQPDEKDGTSPVVVYIHGGGWVSGDKSDGAGALFIRELRRLGYMVAAVNYRLAPDFRFPAQIQDVKCAIRYLRANAGFYGLDPQRIGAIGGSAGGHLVALLGTSDARAGFDVGQYLDQSSRLQAVVDLFGPADLVRMMNEPHRPIGERVFGITAMGAEQVKPFSPVTYISPDDPPFLIMHGERDELVPVDQSQTFYDQLAAAGVPVELVIVKNAGHGFLPVGGPINPSLQELIQIAARFLNQYLKGK